MLARKYGTLTVFIQKRCSKFFVSSAPHSTSLMSTHQTSSNVLNGLLDVHAWPVVQHVTDTGCTVDKADIIFTSLWHGVKTGSTKRRKKPQSQKSYINSLKWPECVQARSEFKSCRQSQLRRDVMFVTSGASESEPKCQPKFVFVCVQVWLLQNDIFYARECSRVHESHHQIGVF